jgi:polyketide synthase PksM
MNEQWLITVANPVLRDHMVYGQHLMPGLAYVDLLYQLFRKHRQDYSSLELRNVSIYHPLAVEQTFEVMLDIRATQQPSGHGNQRAVRSISRIYISVAGSVGLCTANS